MEKKLLLIFYSISLLIGMYWGKVITEFEYAGIDFSICEYELVGQKIATLLWLIIPYLVYGRLAKKSSS